MIPAGQDSSASPARTDLGAIASEPHPVPAGLGEGAVRYRPPVWLRGGHLQSVWPTLFRRVELAEPEAQVIATSDEDELHLDWYRQGSNRLAILCHGLEGHSRRPYICLLYTSPSPRDRQKSRMPSSA